jgi:hypothetical protein
MVRLHRFRRFSLGDELIDAITVGWLGGLADR